MSTSDIDFGFSKSLVDNRLLVEVEGNYLVDKSQVVNATSSFTGGAYVTWLIDQAGWKGKKFKNAGVYEKQALVLVNNGGATGGDVVQLAQSIQKDILEKFGINIKPEAIYI